MRNRHESKDRKGKVIKEMTRKEGEGRNGKEPKEKTNNMKGQARKARQGKEGKDRKGQVMTRMDVRGDRGTER